MEKERLQEYAARVTQANRSELVVIIYEATLASAQYDYGVDGKFRFAV